MPNNLFYLNAFRSIKQKKYYKNCIGSFQISFLKQNDLCFKNQS